MHVHQYSIRSIGNPPTETHGHVHINAVPGIGDLAFGESRTCTARVEIQLRGLIPECTNKKTYVASVHNGKNCVQDSRALQSQINAIDLFFDCIR